MCPEIKGKLIIKDLQVPFTAGIFFRSKVREMMSSKFNYLERLERNMELKEHVIGFLEPPEDFQKFFTLLWIS